MNKLKNLLVALDYTRMDEILVCYTAFICRMIEVEKVYFVHVQPKASMPNELLQMLDIVDEPDEHPHLKQDMQALIKEYFGNLREVQTELLLPNGQPLKEILRLNKEKDIDLMVSGRKLRLRGSGILANKLLNTGKASMLLVPETANPSLQRVVVSTDFSEYSDLTLRHVMEMAKYRPGLEIICLHVYEVPTSYITLGVSYDSFEAKARHFAEAKFNDMLQHFPELHGRACLNLVKKGPTDDTGEILVLESKRLHADLMAVGARGLSGASLFMLGSVTENVIRNNTDIPLLVFKKKDEDLSFIDALIGA